MRPCFSAKVSAWMAYSDFCVFILSPVQVVGVEVYRLALLLQGHLLCRLGNSRAPELPGLLGVVGFSFFALLNINRKMHVKLSRAINAKYYISVA